MAVVVVAMRGNSIQRASRHRIRFRLGAVLKFKHRLVRDQYRPALYTPYLQSDDSGRYTAQNKREIYWGSHFRKSDMLCPSVVRKTRSKRQRSKYFCISATALSTATIIPGWRAACREGLNFVKGLEGHCHMDIETMDWENNSPQIFFVAELRILYHPSEHHSRNNIEWECAERK